VSLGDLTAFLRRRWRLLAVCTFGCLLAVAAVLLVRDREYTSSASFVPQASDKLSALSGLAAQFGVAAGGPDATESPAFYVDLLSTREILTTVLEGQYPMTTDRGARQVKLIDALNVSESTPARRVDKAIEKLTKRLQVAQKARTGVVSLSLRLEDPQLVQAVVRRLMDEVGRFSATKRNAKAAAEAKFTERRMSELRSQLREAEDQLQTFLQQNRDYRNSPELTFRHERLQTEVDFLRTILTSVSQSNERARMDEARDTPVIMIIENPSLPSKPDSRGFAKFGALAIVVGGILGLGWGLLEDMRDRLRIFTK
jgi:uncharacterized protein involved in exopolysaccharide biosynthesis